MLFTRSTASIFVLALLLSCTDHQLLKSTRAFKNQQITLSSDWNAIWKGRDTVLAGFTQVPVKLVVWYDSLGCASCQMSKMSDWTHITAYADSLSPWFNIIYLFTPKEQDVERLHMTLRGSRLDYPVFIDQHATFVKQNKLPRHPELHSFLLDKNNRVIMVGNPLYNSALWDFYKRTIQRMIANNGILPES